ncbi:MAG TPA: hypothetical protein VM099_13575 [Gemmatimonadaceae bacterium]|nr:hypothetical protein [Gemmatimonadaceae bacterium]
MFNNEDFDLTENERAAFAALPRERATGDLLEERVVRQLRSNGYFSSRDSRRRIAGWALRAAAAVFLFAAGALTERMLSSRGENAAPVSIAPSRAIETKPSPVQRTDPTKVAQLEQWI